MKVKRFDNGGEAQTSEAAGLEATAPASTFYDAYARNPTANYVPSGARRSVGTGVAVQDPYLQNQLDPPGYSSASGTLNTVESPEQRGLLSGSIIPMTGTEMQRALTSYAPGSFGSRLATGYQQLFGRPVDVEGAQYFMNRFGNQNLDQATVNRILLAGAQGADREAAQDYQLSLTGGRPDYEARMAQGLSAQYMQPIYHGTAQDYLQPRAPTESLFSPGFNPFNYASPPSDARLGQIRESLFPYSTTSQGGRDTPMTRNDLNEIYMRELGRPLRTSEDVDYWLGGGTTLKKPAEIVNAIRQSPEAQAFRNNQLYHIFNTYTGYNPFAAKAVNPYATRMPQPERPAALSMLGPEQPVAPSPTVRQNMTNPFVRSVGEGVAVDFGPSTARPQAPTNFPYLSPYLQAYGRNGGVGMG